MLLEKHTGEGCTHRVWFRAWYMSVLNPAWARAQVRIMARKMEEDYARAVDVELQRRAREQLLASLDKIRAPISVAEVTREATKILFANRAWANTIGAPASRRCFTRGACARASQCLGSFTAGENRAPNPLCLWSPPFLCHHRLVGRDDRLSVTGSCAHHLECGCAALQVWVRSR